MSRRRDAAGCIVHSDRGSQFRSRKFVHALNRHHLIGSMGQVGAAGDNAAMESFFSLLQKNVLDRKRWRTREELRMAIITLIERSSLLRRRHALMFRLTRSESATTMSPVALAASCLACHLTVPQSSANILHDRGAGTLDLLYEEGVERLTSELSAYGYIAG